MIKVLYFARLREQLDTDTEELQATPEITSVAAIIEQLKARGGVWQEVFGDGQSVMAAVNQEMGDTASAVSDGDEVAFFPPVTGG